MLWFKYVFEYIKQYKYLKFDSNKLSILIYYTILNNINIWNLIYIKFIKQSTH